MRFVSDWWITLVYLLAASLSLVMLASVSPDRLPLQASMLGVGLVLMLYLGRQEKAVYQTFAPIGYGFSVLLLLITFILGATIRGSTRWLTFGGFQLQSGEIVKPLLILAFAYFLEKYPPKSLKNILLNLGLFLVPTLLIFKQPDLGTALVMGVLWLFQLFVAGIPWLYIGLGGVAGLGLLQLLPRFLHDYQLARLESFVDPYHDPLGAGYNVIQSIIAVGSGGLWGKGIGHGTQSHLRFLPERHTDFAFATLAEELGLIGSLLIILILSALLLRLLIALTQARHQIDRLILAGILGSLTFQTFVNIGMNLGIAPVTGVTLPLAPLLAGNSLV